MYIRKGKDLEGWNGGLERQKWEKVVSMLLGSGLTTSLPFPLVWLTRTTEEIEYILDISKCSV